LQDVISAVQKVTEAARQFEGLVEIGAWLGHDKQRVVKLSLWESKEYADKATKEMHQMFADIPWDHWERMPAENLLGLNRVV